MGMRNLDEEDALRAAQPKTLGAFLPGARPTPPAAPLGPQQARVATTGQPPPVDHHPTGGGAIDLTSELLSAFRARIVRASF
jgi:hypothetical protein